MKIRRFRVGGRIEIPLFGTTLSAGVENLQNYVYFNTLALPEQEGGSVQVFSASLSQNFRLGILHWNNRLTYQTSSNESVLPLPKLAVYSDLFLSFTVSKVLKINLGVDCNYYTNYYAPAYQPSTMSFYNQTEKKLGNYPFMNAYAHMKVSKTRFFVLYSHLH